MNETEKYTSEGKLEVYECIKGVSSEVASRLDVLSSKEAYFLNSLFWDAIGNLPMRDFIKGYPDLHNANLNPNSEIKLWLGRQAGEMMVKPTYNERSGKLELTAKKKAIIELGRYFRMNDFLANKYLNLNEGGFFEDFKHQNLSEYWLWRVNIDLKNYKTLLEGMVV